MVDLEYLKFRIMMEKKKILKGLGLVCLVSLLILSIVYLPKHRAVQKEKEGIPLPPTGDIKIYSDRFEPSEFRISPGGKVTWVNLDTRFYTLTIPGIFEVIILPNDTFTFAFYREGTYEFGVIENPNIKGRIIVS